MTTKMPMLAVMMMEDHTTFVENQGQDKKRKVVNTCFINKQFQYLIFPNATAGTKNSVDKKRIQGWLGGAGFLSKGRSSIFARRLFVLYHTCNPRLVIIVPTPVSGARLRLCFFVLVFRLFFEGGMYCQ